ncbi:uncharacterized protein TRIADDRAFT_28417 [Trichoplax adhaerens]|uniref:LIM zinc-binding domain-containing protein n=1 Tax=Trichoplax adhaerens TaxID=10228 RepID=B3S3F1_TRIAD|nr:hypothetical protein TRIADDRAFT_28417 [Trichoplax adhaerens]EDV22780.1 hypothetical protein TRIADDRAFT_28417 [Trichoplax adhaerens]|eukprot:XP_002114646.1 hypothetical protein TRIADDRAFT_28417 [Trichoplax adhaerens]
MNYSPQHHPNRFVNSISCRKCGRPCSGETLKVANDFFHSKCFTCKVCGVALVNAGYFSQGEDYYCVYDYHRIYGTRCNFCGGFIEGEAIKCAGEAFHKRCFDQKANRSLPSATNDKSPNKLQSRSPSSTKSSENIIYPKCGGCKQEIRGGQALIALDQQWHTWCFTCNRCGKQLSGEYLGRDGIPLCEDDYLKLYGIICAGCGHYIVGKFLEVGERNFHSECAHCVHCTETFREGQEILIYKDDLFHSSCLKSSALVRS